MSVISLVNLKGGVAKTVSTINLAAAMSKAGKTVLILDTDSQGNIAAAMGIKPGTLEHSLVNLMAKAIQTEIPIHEIERCIMHLGNVDILPSNSLLAGLEVMLMNAVCREAILKSITDQIKNRYDYIFIDCPPSLGTIVLNVMVASDYLVIPVESHYLCYESLKSIMETIHLVRMKLNPNLKIAGILFTMYQRRTNLSKEIRELVKETYGDNIRIFEDYIPYSIKAAEQTLYGKSIIDINPKHPVAVSYTNIAREMIANGI